MGGESDFSFQNHSGRYTLLNFWAAYDAESRVRNVQLWNEVNKLSSDKIAMYSVSLDEKESIFTETVKADRLPTVGLASFVPDDIVANATVTMRT